MTDKEALADHPMREVQRLGQEIEQEPACPECKATVLYECVACSSNNYPPPQRTEQEPVAWLLTDKNINSIQVNSIQRLINRLNHAHHTDIRVRINGQDEWFEADWLKHMVIATPPQRTEPLIGCVNHDCAKCKPSEQQENNNG
jgi:hypothetical protein